MLKYMGWQQKDIAHITGYSHIYVRKCSTSPEHQYLLESAINIFEYHSDNGRRARNNFNPVKYQTPPKGMKNWDLISEAITGYFNG
jgi:hypothetical protein